MSLRKSTARVDVEDFDYEDDEGMLSLANAMRFISYAFSGAKWAFHLGFIPLIFCLGYQSLAGKVRAKGVLFSLQHMLLPSPILQ